ncbi:MAG: hypothetical protein PHS38_12155 [Bacteroidales bacterium]|jgi:hypothetical protein|nr:hypothetical protein [Bacteroidales bacterium]
MEINTRTYERRNHKATVTGYGIKYLFADAKPVGKLISLTLNINDDTSLPDYVTLINYKKNLP